MKIPETVRGQAGWPAGRGERERGEAGRVPGVAGMEFLARLVVGLEEGCAGRADLEEALAAAILEALDELG